ncbi:MULTISPECIES: GNAT family N-acetyltransferase [Acidaminococcus]|jgi:predicted GNAT family N-acyltransferase|uniref:GNAT family N-acetyltransferase n=1 Tax=Acidaminococcus TaxID=904 RepID=UPI0023F50D80|nr:GNAT family N-acetyltransferase [Acidaminococcus massiliensis]
MRFTAYEQLPQEARALREEVFCREQGFQEEFDETDRTAYHGLLWDDGGQPVGVCRFFLGPKPGTWILGRVAVKKALRKTGVGSELIRGMEEAVRKLGGREIQLHAQVRARHFYETLGYQAYGPEEPEEGVLHQWMKKKLEMENKKIPSF